MNVLFLLVFLKAKVIILILLMLVIFITSYATGCCHSRNAYKDQKSWIGSSFCGLITSIVSFIVMQSLMVWYITGLDETLFQDFIWWWNHMYIGNFWLQQHQYFALSLSLSLWVSFEVSEEWKRSLKMALNHIGHIKHMEPPLIIPVTTNRERNYDTVNYWLEFRQHSKSGIDFCLSYLDWSNPTPWEVRSK
jgi:hypothetical protein